MSDLRTTSRAGYDAKGPTFEEINAGSLQRIADAMEKMAASYTALQADRDYWKRRAENETEIARGLQRQVSALRGVITRIKRSGSDE